MSKDVLKAALIHESYIAGVLHGDGWCTPLTIGLRCKDRDFAEAFASSLNIVFGLNVSARIDERGYSLVRVSNITGRFDRVRNYTPQTPAEAAAWLRGMFDSEGNAQITRVKYCDSWYRRVSLYSTTLSTLCRARHFLMGLGITCRIRRTKNSKSHFGTKTVYELSLRCSAEHFQRFATLVGSNIGRKRDRLSAIVGSYCKDLKAALRAAQAKGAAETHRRAMLRNVPVVLSGIRDLISRGIKPTQRACRPIPGFNSIQKYFPQAELVRIATEEIPCVV